MDNNRKIKKCNKKHSSLNLSTTTEKDLISELQIWCTKFDIKIHTKMVLKLSGHLAPELSEWCAFKQLLRIHLSPVEVKHVKSMFDVFEILIRRGIIQYGKYKAVKDIFSSMEHMQCFHIVEDYENQMQLTHQHNETAEPRPTAQDQVPEATLQSQPNAAQQIQESSTSQPRPVSQHHVPPVTPQNQSNSAQQSDGQQQSTETPNIRMLPSSDQTADRSEIPDCMMQAFETLRRNLVEILQVTISRDHILHDVLQLYRSEDILFKRLHVCFQGEDGQDAGGLTKDMLASFWDEAIKEFFEGENCVVPSLPTHRLAEATEIFSALGRVLSHGIALTQSLPIKLSRSAMFTSIYGQRFCDDDVLLDDVLMYMSERERVLTQKGLDSFDDLTTEEMEDLTDMFCTRFRMQVLPAKRTFKQNILNIARNELITKPSHYFSIMKSSIPDVYLEAFFNRVTPDDINKLYKSLRPKQTDVVRILKTEHDPLRPEEEVIFYFLKDFISSLSSDDLILFLQFVTGSNTMPSTSITVTFNREDGIRRHPVAHTCGNVLELPIQYNDLQEFKREFMTILHDNDAFRMHML